MAENLDECCIKEELEEEDIEFKYIQPKQWKSNNIKDAQPQQHVSVRETEIHDYIGFGSEIEKDGFRELKSEELQQIRSHTNETKQQQNAIEEEAEFLPISNDSIEMEPVKIEENMINETVEMNSKESQLTILLTNDNNLQPNASMEETGNKPIPNDSIDIEPEVNMISASRQLNSKESQDAKRSVTIRTLDRKEAGIPPMPNKAKKANGKESQQVQPPATKLPEVKKSRSAISSQKCCISHCQSSRRDFPDLRLFKFPKSHPSILMQWAAKCNFSEDFVINSSALFLCQYHFSPDDLGLRYLKPGTIPDRNLNAATSTYIMEKKKTSGDDVDFLSDLSLLRSPPRNKVQPVPRCRQCKKSTEALKFFQEQNSSLKTSAEARKARIKMLKRERDNLKQQVRRLQVKASKTIISEIDDNVKLTENEKILTKMLVKKKQGTSTKWSDSEKQLAQIIFGKSQTTYKFLRNSLELNLPHQSSLQKWKHKSLQPENSESN